MARIVGLPPPLSLKKRLKKQRIRKLSPKDGWLIFQQGIFRSPVNLKLKGKNIVAAIKRTSIATNKEQLLLAFSHKFQADGYKSDVAKILARRFVEKNFPKAE